MSTVPTNPLRLNLFGRWLAGVRANLGDTQLELARRLNMSPDTIGHWERGQLPLAKALLQPTRFLGVNPMESVSRHFGAQLANEPYAAILLQDEIQRQILALGETSVNVAPSSNAFGSALRTFRERREVTIKTAAKDLNVSREYLRNLELGHKYPSAKMLQALAVYYQRELQELAVLLIASRMVKHYRDFGVDLTAVCRQASREAKTRIARIQRCNAFGEALQIWRESRRMDQTEAARGILIEASYLAQLENGRAAEISVELLERITGYYNKGISDVIPLLLASQAVKKHETVSIDFPRLFGRAAEAAKDSVTRVKQCNGWGETLRSWREERGHTQSQAAVALGVCKTALTSFEVQKTFPTAEILSALSEHYGKDLSTAVSLHFLSQTVQQYGSHPFDFYELLQQAARRAEHGSSSPLGELIKNWRSESGLTIKSAAQGAGVSYASLGKWESGEVPTLDSLKTIANFYGKNLHGALPSLFIAQAMQKYQTLPVDIPVVLRQAADRARDGIIEVSECNALGDRLRNWRTELGKTVEQVEAELGAPAGEFSRLERGQYLPSFTALRSLADYYRRDFNDVFPLLLLTKTVKTYPALLLNFEQLFQQASRIASDSIAQVQTSYALGDAMCGWRNELGQTQAETAGAIGVSSNTFSAWEAGYKIPEYESFVRLVRYCGRNLTEAVSTLLLTETFQEYGSLGLDFSEVFEQAAVIVQSTAVQVQTTNAAGELLTRWRQERREKQNDVTRALEMGQGYLAKIESGGQIPAFNALTSLVQHYEKSIEQIIPSYVVTSAIRQYAFLNLNLPLLLQTTLDVLPQGLQLGFDGSAISDLLNGKSNFLGDKLRRLIQESGISLHDQSGLQTLARECGIDPDTFIGFLRGDRSLGDFLGANQTNLTDPIDALSARLAGINTQLIGLLGIDIGFAHEVQSNRQPEYVSRQDGGPGYDLHSLDSSRSDWRKIEIKASLGVDPFVLFTVHEWDAAERYREDYYLEVILNSSTPWPTLISIQDPFKRFEPQEVMERPHVRFHDIRTLLDAHGHPIDPIPPGVIEVSV